LFLDACVEYRQQLDEANAEIEKLKALVNGCTWPSCKSDEYQSALSDEIVAELYGPHIVGYVYTSSTSTGIKAGAIDDQLYQVVLRFIRL